MNLKSVIRGKIKFPKIDMTDELEHVAEKIVIPRIAKGIQEGKSINGKTYRSLAPSTIKQKGHARPLIETGKLHKSPKFRVVGKNRVAVFVSGERKEIAKYLQVEGIKTKRGKRYFNFFGVTPAAEKKSVKHLANKIKEYTDRAGR